MIGASSGVNSVAKVTQTEWDLSTGTVKRRPTSLESCKSNDVDFPHDKSKNAKDITSCNINKAHDDNDDDLSPEIVVRRKRIDEVKKIDSPSLKKKLETARKSFSSKLKLPNSLSHLSPSRRSLPNKLSQLERQNNLFIRDGQQINKKPLVVMADNENAAPGKSKKSLIPSFLASSSSGVKNNSNHIKIQSSSTSVKKAPNVVEKLTKTGNKFRELYRDTKQTNLKRTPPPYRPPPTPSSSNSNLVNKQKRNRLTEEIDVIVEENVQEIEDLSAVSTDSNIDNMLAKAEYSSNVFKNIPVRARKGGAVSHMENYCLFDPSVDFCNEKELMKKKMKFPFNIENEEKIEDITFEDHTVYDITEHDERVANHNYYEIDPELLEKEDKKMSSSSDSNSTTHSSTTTSSSDYPSLFNSVIETTHSSNVESTDDNDSNGYGKCENFSNESIITVQNVATACGTKAKKKAPQLDRIIQPRNKHYPKSSKTNKISTQLDPLKQSHSLPQLQNVKCKSDNNLVIDMAIQLRRPYSARQGRPLSTTSDDRDSGFLSPATPPDCCAQNVKDSTMLNQCDNIAIQQLIEIYTQWANYYLERAKAKRRVIDLSTDCRDGLLLAEVIEAVTNFKVPDLVRKPKTQQQMLDNVEACLNILRQNDVGGLESITASDICAGRLKAVLSLFFSLSRYKQANKLKTPTKSPQIVTHQAQIHHQSVQSLNSSQGDMRQLPVPQKIGNGTSIPMPSSVAVARRSTDKIPRIPVPNGQAQTMIRYPSGTPSSENSRPNSPPDSNRGSGIRYPSNSKLSPSPYTISSHESMSNADNIQSTAQQQAPVKHSMLDKLKLFNKDKDRSKSSKRTSSSSGFSSARSDSSLSLNNDPNTSAMAVPCKSKKNEIVNGTNKATSSSKSSKIASNGSSKKEAPAPIVSAMKTQSKSDKKKNMEMSMEQPVTKLQPQKMPSVKFQPQQISQMQQQQMLLKQQQQLYRKIEIRTDMKPSTGLPQPQQTKVIIQPITSIPKPMAAIKGQSKAQIKADEIFADVIKMDKKSSSSSMSLNEQKTQIVNPLTMSPLHNQLRAQNGQNASSQSMSDSVHSTSTNNHSNSSESSVIYRPSASESEFYHSNISSTSSMQHRNPIPNRKVDHFNDALLTNGHKFNTIPTKLNGAAATTIGNNQMMFGEEQQKAQQGLRSIMRGYNNQQQHVTTLPTRGARSGQNLVNGYYEEHHNQGYCSDGDALRKTPIRYTDIENGYASEGGGGGVTNPHFMSIFRNRPQLPTTIAEERCRTNENGNLDESLEMGLISGENWRQRMGENLKDKSAMKMKSKAKGVPQTFGYIKKSNGSATATEISTSALMSGGSRTAAVSAVPRTNKLKVSGGTQTAGSDLQQKSMQYKSYSLTGQGAAQLSQSVKDRFASGTNSLPKSGLEMHAFQARMANRAASKTINDGSLSDTYSDIKEYSSYSMWLRHSNTSSRLSDGGESLDGMSIRRLLQHRNSSQSPAHKLNRSNSISYLQGIRTYPRSTKSDKTYPSMLSRMTATEIETEPYYCLPASVNGGLAAWSSQPTSPTPRNLTGLISPTHSNSPHRFVYHGSKKNDEAHGSQISLMSGGSSMYGSCTEEQRQANEVRRLKRELTEAREQVMSLSSQLSTNAHVVNAFEKSLATMTNRLQLLTATTEKKEGEIVDMRQTIELLKKQSIQAGLHHHHIESMGKQVTVNGTIEGSPSKKIANGSHEGLQNGSNSMQRQLSTDSVCSINSLSSNCSMQDKKKKKGWLRSSFTKAFTRNAKISKTNQPHHLGMNGTLSESKSSLQPPPASPQKLPPKMPSNVDLSTKPPISPTKMSSHQASRQVTLIENARPYDSIEIENHPIVEELKKQLREKDMVLTDIRLEALTQASQMETLKETVKAMRQEMIALKQNNERLQKIVTHRSLAGSENSIGCPASPCSGGDSRRYSFATDSGHSRPPLDLPDNLDETEEEEEIPTPGPAPLSPNLISELSSPTLDRISLSNDILTTAADEIADAVDGKKISIAVFLGQFESFPKYMESIIERFNDDDGLQTNGSDNLKFNTSRDDDNDLNSSEMIIAFTYISGKTTWQNLDYIVRKTFKDYLSRIDPGTNLGLNTDSITSYHLGEAKRGPEMGFPEFLPCGYLIGNVGTLYICLQGVGSLAFDTLIPRSIVHRYINLLTEHRRIIFCGPKGTGKSHLARKLGEFLVAKLNRSSPAESIATFNVDHKSSKELQQYLSHIAEQASINGLIEELPAVIILDNLHHASELGDVFSCLLSAGSVKKLPYIICTMSQATCNTSNLQLHHNFRWVLTANHMEPVKGFLGRFLRRKLFEMELRTGSAQSQMEKILRWLPTVVQHINSFLESHSSSDVTIGPNLFLECPLDIIESQKWFVDLWNENLAPYMIDAIKEGIQLYGRRGNAWTDPCLYIRETYPWQVTPSTVPKLRTITAQDVGLEESEATSSTKEDPLLNMLNQLKEAASWNEIQQEDSDCLSLDSNFTHDSSVENN